MQNTIANEIIRVAVYIAVAVAASYLIGFLYNRILKTAASKTTTSLDDLILEYTEKPVRNLALVAGFYFVTRVLVRYEQPGRFSFLKVIDGAFFTVAVIVAAFFLYGLIKAVLEWYKTGKTQKTRLALDEFIPLIKRLTQIAVFFIASMIILSHFNINISGLIATAGVASLAFALAAQDSIANMIAGFLIMSDRPFRAGDRIELADGTAGDVLEIGLRSTKIMSADNTVSVIPNSELARVKITNFGYPDPIFTVRQIIGVAYGTDIEKVKKALREICAASPDVLKDPREEIYFTEFGESSLNILLMYRITDYRDKLRIMDILNTEIKKRFEAENISMPFPQRDVHIIK
jgi:MscS family membrane protein